MARFLIDQQLPQALARRLVELGHDARHIKEYPRGTTMSDPKVARIADSECRAVVTKDNDFRVSHLLDGRPRRLVHMTCGNISTRDLLQLVESHLDAFVLAAEHFDYFEISQSGIAVHDPE